MSTLTDTPSGDRIHIGFFGKVNSGKSSLVNMIAMQDLSIVSDVAGTTTDPVRKSIEIHPIGASLLIDTAGLEDDTALSLERKKRTLKELEISDIVVLCISSDMDFSNASSYIHGFLDLAKGNIIISITKSDLDKERALSLREYLEREKIADIIGFCITSSSGDGREELLELFSRAMGDRKEKYIDITYGLVERGDTVLLVMPQDIQAPKGRLILPQVQTIRELLDKHAIVISTTKEEMTSAVSILRNPPKLIITDSQIFDYVYENKPSESMLTSFSVLFARLKGDLDIYIDGARYIDKLDGTSRVLIAECCTHAPLTEDIGRVKIPAMLRKRYGEGMRFDISSGADFPSDIEKYDLIIQCGACMLSRKHVISRIYKADNSSVPITNYGICIAYLKGILDKIVY